MNAKQIYVAKMSEVTSRVDASEGFLAAFVESESIPLLEAAVLQARKALESVAYAAIAPNKISYEKLRSKAERPADYRKDYNARSILQGLAKVNPDFYPSPLLPAKKTGPKHWHYERRVTGFLTKPKFERFYDRLGKYLHADNPWGNDKGFQNLARDLPTLFEEIRSLLSLHVTVIRSPGFDGVWVVEVPGNGRPPHILEAHVSPELLSGGGG